MTARACEWFLLFLPDLCVALRNMAVKGCGFFGYLSWYHGTVLLLAVAIAFCLRC